MNDNDKKINLKKVSVSGLLYRFSERLLAQLISTVVSLFLARLLLPEDYGVIAIVTSVVVICNVFVTDGLGGSLVQKKDSDELDFSSVFWVGFGAAIVIYIILFFAAPFIADYYGKPILCPVFRVVTLRIPLASLNTVQNAFVSKNFMFRKFFFATLTGTLVSGLIGVSMAFLGFGVWALAAQLLANQTIDTFFLFFTIKWKPKLMFSFARFKELYSFGWKIMVSGLIGSFYDELRGFIIAKKYSSASLAYYSKGKSLPALIGSNISTTLSHVLFPVFSKIQDDRDRLYNSVRQSMRVGAFLLSPILIGFSSISETFVKLILTEKWLPCVPFIYVYCALFLFKPMKNISKNSVKAQKRSDIDLVINIIEKTIGITLIVVCLFVFGGSENGPLFLALGALLTYIIAALMNMLANGKLLGYKFRYQLRDTVPYIFVSGMACAPSFIIDYIWNSNSNLVNIGKLALQIVISVVLYLVFTKLFRFKEFNYILGIIKDHKKGNKTHEKQ